MTATARLRSWCLTTAMLWIGHAAAMPIDRCGLTVPSGETGVLSGDLTCTDDTPSVVVSDGAVLDLAGHTLTLGAANAVVQCIGRACAVVSSAPGGTIAALYRAIHGTDVRLTLADVTVVVTPTPTAADAVAALGSSRIEATNASIVGATLRGLTAKRIDATNVTLSDCWIGVMGDVVRGTGVTISGGGYGMIALRTVRLTAAQVHDAVAVGIRSGRKIRLTDSSVTNNGAGHEEDLNSGRRPFLLNSTCGKSHVVSEPPGPGNDWGVCAND